MTFFDVIFPWLLSIWAFVLVYFVFLSDGFLEDVLEKLEKSNHTVRRNDHVIPELHQDTVMAEEINEHTKEDLPKELSFSKERHFSYPLEESPPLEELSFPTENIAIHEQQEYRSWPREPSAFEKFFSENVLAKIWGILVFLGVLFLLSLIYSVIGPVTKMCVWLIIGFSCFGAWVWLDKKWYTNESRIVMGTAILINYLVILSGRHLLWSDVSSDATLVSVWMTFVFLILNTFFAVTTALVYNSRQLLIFSFIFAYANPLLLWAAGTEPYTLLGYSMIVTLWAMYMAYSRKDEILFPLSFILAAIMFLIAPWSDWYGWIAKLICINILGTVSLYVSSGFEKKYQNLGEVLIAGTFFLIGVMWFLGITQLSSFQLWVMWASSIGLMLVSYYNMNKWAYLYSIWTLGTVLTLTPTLISNGLRVENIFISGCIIVGFALCNIWVILTKNKEILAENLWSIISALVSWALFLSFMIYEFGNIYFSWIAQWFGFFFLAVIYSSLAFFVVQKIWIAEVKSHEKYQNIFYTLSALWVSLFSLAVAFVFAESPEIISIIWILEAAVLFYLSSKTHSQKIAIWALILFAIWIFQYISFIDMRIEKSYGLIVSCVIVFLSIFHTLYSVSRKNSVFKKNTIFQWAYTLLHIIWIFSASCIIIIISDVENEWISLLWAWTGAVALYYIYQYFQSQSLILFSKCMIICVCLVHVIFVNIWINFASFDIILSLLILAITIFPPLFDSLRSQKIVSRNFFSILGVYAFIISSLYIYQITTSTFAVTLYWGILSFILLWHGISKDILTLRTLWLYVISLTIGKVFLYDIWMSVDDTVSRVVALIVIWILLIVLSTMYTRKYGNNLTWEFSPQNLFSGNTQDMIRDEILKK